MHDWPRKRTDIIQILERIRYNKAIDPYIAQSFLNYVRQCLEAKGLGSKYKALSTYCDWIFHTQLNRKKHDHFFIRLHHTLTSAIESEPELGLDGVTKAITSRGLSINDFFQQLIELLNYLQISDFSSSDIALIVREALTEVSDKPLKPSKRVLDPNGNVDWTAVSSLFGKHNRIIPTEINMAIDQGQFFPGKSAIVKISLILDGKPGRILVLQVWSFEWKPK